MVIAKVLCNDNIQNHNDNIQNHQKTEEPLRVRYWTQQHVTFAQTQQLSAYVNMWNPYIIAG